jgi:serine/threonine protein kinase/tetratricopeptide (TPR) repeat protein
MNERSSRTSERANRMTERSSRVRGFVRELRRRRVFRVLAAYTVVGLAVGEGAGIFFPALGFPAWTVNFVTILVILALPLALVLAWAYDVVPDTGAVPGVDAGSVPEGSGAIPSRPARHTTPATTPARASSSSPMPTDHDTAARWALVQELFMKALDVPDTDRQAFVKAGAATNPQLRAEVLSLLGAHDETGPLDDLRNRIVAPMLERTHSVEELEGESVLHYEVLEKLGGGGMGVVYKARDTRLGRIVTLKFLSAHLLSDTEAKDRFLVEARAAASLDHPNLCTVHEIGETDDGRLYIAMAYYDGETLRRRIGRGRLEVAEALDLAAQISRGLARAAEGGIIHRDIKPGNIMLADEDAVKIVDFGLAKMSDGELTRTGARMGTVSYMSPEQTRGEAVDQRTDVWSVGVVLYEMLAGKRPFHGGSDQAVIHAILNDEPADLETLVPGLSPSVAAIVARAIRKDAGHRYPDAASLLKDLEQLLLDPDSQGSRDRTASLPADGERRIITVLSCGVTGFETVLDTMEPDAADQKLATLRGRAHGVIDDYGGVLNEFSEDHFVALFGVPVVHEDDVLRAVRAALEIHDVCGRDGGLQLHSAIGSGLVAIRPTDSAERPYRVGGTITRDIGRLAGAAGVGDILIPGDLARSVAPFVDTEERAEISLTPDGPLVRPLAVLGESEVDSRLDASLPGSLTRFVGRTDEMNSLTRAMEGANTGSGRLVSIVGDAGVGKSRLLHEFRTALADDSIRYIQGRCHAYGTLTPFLPFIECVKAMLGLARSPQDQVHDHVVTRTRALASELEIYIPVLLHLLSIDSHEHPLPTHLVGEDLRAGIVEGLLSLFTLGSRGQPLVILLEDWHWADGGSTEVLEQLVEMASSYPLLILVTARPESDGQRSVPRGRLHIDLSPLESGSAVEIMRASFGGARLSAELADRLVEKTGGNPFFIEELCHALVSDGTIVVEGGDARMTGSLDRVTIPDTVQAVLKTRLDRLDPEAREVLRSASVIGREFGIELLGSVVPSRSRLEGALDTLRASGLVQRTTLIPEPMYRFKHALTLDVTYDSLLARQRRDRHALVGEAIERLYPEQLDVFANRLANHFAGAQDWARAVMYGFKASARSSAVWRVAEAVGMLDRLRPWIEHMEVGDAERRKLLTRLLLEQERHLETLGRREDQQAAINDLLDVLPSEASPELATVLVRQGELFTLVGQFAAAESAFEKAHEMAESCGAVEEKAMALRAVGHRYWQLGKYREAIGPLEQVIEHDRTGASSTILLRDLINLGRVRRELGHWAEAQAIGAEVQALATVSGNATDQVYSANYMGHLLKAMGRPKDALQVLMAGSAIASDAHLPVRLSFHLLTQAALELELGHVEASLDTYTAATVAARRAGRADNLAHTLRLRGDALSTIGQPEEAIESYEEAVAILRQVSEDVALAETLSKLAMVYEATGHSEALSTWREVAALRDAMDDAGGALEAAEHEARLVAHDPAAAAALYERGLDIAVALNDIAAEARIRNSLALLAWRGGQLERAAEHYQAASERLVTMEDRRGRGVVLNGLGAVLSGLGRHEEAYPVLLEALEENRADDDLAREADSLSALGASARAGGDLTRAYDWYHQCLERRRVASDRGGEGWALRRLSELSIAADAADRAEEFAREALAIAREVGDEELELLCAGDADPGTARTGVIP